VVTYIKITHDKYCLTGQLLCCCCYSFKLGLIGEQLRKKRLLCWLLWECSECTLVIILWQCTLITVRCSFLTECRTVMTNCYFTLF